MGESQAVYIGKHGKYMEKGGCILPLEGANILNYMHYNVYNPKTPRFSVLSQTEIIVNLIKKRIKREEKCTEVTNSKKSEKRS